MGGSPEITFRITPLKIICHAKSKVAYSHLLVESILLSVFCGLRGHNF